jgi:hypothetical protein
MHQRIATLFLILASAGALAAAASLESAERLYSGGDANGARQALVELLATDDGSDRAGALKLLGQIEVEAKRWAEALAAWEELAEGHSGSDEASSVAAALAPLRALAECGCGSPEQAESMMAAAPPAETVNPPAATPPVPAPPPTPAPEPAREPTVSPAEAPRAPTVESAPTPAPGSAAGVILVGGWSKSFESSQEATKAMADWLEEAGVAVQFVPTDVAAARGPEVTLSFLLDQAEESGALGVLFFSARFTHRDYVLAESFDARGALLWKEKITGGTELRPSRERGQVRWALVERMQKKLSKRIGTADLPTQ